MVKIAAIGDNCIDCYDNLNEKYVGGNPVNVAVYIKRLGGESTYVGVVGNDENGKKVIDELNKKGICTDYIKIKEGKTAVTHINLLNNERVFGKYEEGVLPELSLTDKELKNLAKNDIVVSGVWGYAEKYFRRLKEYGAVIAMDFSTELSSNLIEEIGEYVDYAFFSYETGASEKLREFMMQTYDKINGIIIVTKGEEGSIVFDGKNFITHGIKNCSVIDTMGAGDSFIAGFLFGIAEGKSIKECMSIGTENSSITIGYRGAW